MTERMTDAMPCPFCGGGAIEGAYYQTAIIVKCKTCGAEIKQQFNESRSLAVRRRDALAAWNRRA